ncbi:GAF domain-containing protein [Gordonia westfalica]|uniref:GAF domain-containing protein n=1 Tax=Gordonia westfalica TaxID=158898 RepID=A0ABU2GR21_9ACTN|nr:GAF domain-containing protein [Gordonia westfalica]MDS1113912.1 GAF domain-containing protein [Gordonia westfalica]
MSSTPDGEFEGSDGPETGHDAPAPNEPAEEMSAQRLQRLAAILSTPGDSALAALLDAVRGADPRAATALRELLSDPARVRAIETSRLLDDEPHPAVDVAIGLTIDALGVSYAALNVITAEGQTNASIAWQAGKPGHKGTRPLLDSLCVYPVVSDSMLVVDDIADHPVLSEHSTARNGEVSSYLGIPLHADDGHVIGTFCVWNTEPHHWSSSDIALLTDLSVVVQEAVIRG